MVAGRWGREGESRGPKTGQERPKSGQEHPGSSPRGSQERPGNTQQAWRLPQKDPRLPQKEPPRLQEVRRAPDLLQSDDIRLTRPRPNKLRCQCEN